MNYQYAVRYSVSYSHANSLGITLWTRYYSYPNMGGTVRETNGNVYGDYGTKVGSYMVASADPRYGYRQGSGSIVIRNNSSGYEYGYGICRKRLQ